MKWVLAGAAVAALTMGFGGGASASMCSNDCNHDYGVCNSLNGGDAQRICMPKWMQCKKACTGAVKTAPTKASNISKPKP